MREPAKRLKRSVQDRMLFGVAGGLAEYFDIDPVLVRVGFVLLTFVNGLGLIGYVILAIVAPKADEPAPDIGDTARKNISDMPGEIADAGRRAGERWRSGRAGGGATWLVLVGALLVVAGILWIFGNLGISWGFFFPFWIFATFWPVAIIVGGVLLIVLAVGRRSG